MRARISIVCVAVLWAAAALAEQVAAPPAAGAAERSQGHELDGLRATLSAPVEVARRKNPRLSPLAEDTKDSLLWYPQVARLANGDLLAQIRLGGETWMADLECPIAFAWCTLHVAFSHDGRKWELRGTVVGPDSPVGRHHWLDHLVGRPGVARDLRLFHAGRLRHLHCPRDGRRAGW